MVVCRVALKGGRGRETEQRVCGLVNRITIVNIDGEWGNLMLMHCWMIGPRCAIGAVKCPCMPVPYGLGEAG